MDLPLEQRFGIFLIAISIWYLIIVEMLNVLSPITAVLDSVLFLMGLRFALSSSTHLAPTKTITKPNAPTQAPTPDTTKPEKTSTPKPTTTSKRVRKYEDKKTIPKKSKPKTKKTRRTTKTKQLSKKPS